MFMKLFHMLKRCYIVVCFPQTNKDSTPKALQENKNHLMSKIICEQSNVILAKRSS